MPAFLDDYAFLVEGLLAAARGDGRDERWLERGGAARRGAGASASATPRAAATSRPARTRGCSSASKPAFDGAVASGNGVAALNAVELARLTGDPAWAERAEATLLAFADGDGPGAARPRDARPCARAPPRRRERPRCGRRRAAARASAAPRRRRGRAACAAARRSRTRPYDAVEIDGAARARSEDDDWKPFRVELDGPQGLARERQPGGRGPRRRPRSAGVVGRVRNVRYPAGETWDGGGGPVPVYRGRVTIEGEIERRGGGAAGLEVALPGVRRRALPAARHAHRAAALSAMRRAPRPETPRAATTRSSSRRTATTWRSAARRASRARRSGAGACSCWPSSSPVGQRHARPRGRCASSGRTTRRRACPAAASAAARARASAPVAERRPEDEDVALEAARLLTEIGPRTQAVHVYAPLGLGASVDHRLTYEAAVRAFATEAGPQPLPVRGAARGVRARAPCGRGWPCSGRACPPAPQRGGRARRPAAAPLARRTSRDRLRGRGRRGSARGSRRSPRPAGASALARPWNPLRAFGPRLQPIVHVADEEAQAPRARRSSDAAAAEGRARGDRGRRERFNARAAAAAKKLGGVYHAERLLALPALGRRAARGPAPPGDGRGLSGRSPCPAALAATPVGRVLERRPSAPGPAATAC